MSLNSLGLGFMFTATDLASGVMKNIASNFQGLQEAAGKNISDMDKMIRGLGAGLTAAAVGAGGLATSFNMAKKAGELEYGLAKVNVVAHASSDELKQIEQFALKSAKALGWKPTEAIEGFQMLGQQGYGTAKMLEMMPTLMKFATAGEMDMAEATELASQAMRAFVINEKFFPEALDQMQASADMFSMSTHDLAIGLSRASGGASLFKATLTDTLALFGMVKDVLHSTQVSGTAVSYMFQGLANPKNHDKIKKALGVDVMDKATGSYRDIVDVLGEMLPQLNKMGEVEQAAFLSDIFGHEAVKGVQALISRLNSGIEDSNHVMHKGVDGLRFAVKNLSQQHGTLSRASELVMDTYDGAMKRLKASTESFLTQMGKPFKDLWRPVLEKLATAMNNMSEALERMDPKTQQAIAAFFTLGAAALTLFGLLGVLKSAWPLVTTGAKLLGGAFKSLGAGILEALGVAFWPIVLALTAIFSVVYAVKNNIGGLGDAWSEMMKKIGGPGLFEAIGRGFATLWDSIKEGFAWAMDTFAPVFEFLAGAFKAIGKQFESFHDKLKVTTGLGSIFGFIFKVIGGILGVVGIAVVGLIALLGYLVAGFLALRNAVIDVVQTVIKKLGEMFGWLGKKLSIFSDWLWKDADKGIKFGVEAEKIVKTVEAPQPPPKPEVKPEAPANRMPTEDESGFIGQYRGTPAGAAVESLNYYQGVVPGKTEKLFDVNELAAAVAKMPVNVSVDGRTILRATRNAEDAERAWGSR